MPDTYVSNAEVKAFVGGDVFEAIDGLLDVDPTQHIEAATAIVQSRLRNNGYSTPTTTTDETVKAAVIALVWESLASVPEVSLSLPANWDTHYLRLAWVDIYEGTATLTHALDKGSAVGGWQWSESSTSVTDARTQRASRSNLKGY